MSASKSGDKVFETKIDGANHTSVEIPIAVRSLYKKVVSGKQKS